MYARYTDFVITGTTLKQGLFWENPVREANVAATVARLAEAAHKASSFCTSDSGCVREKEGLRGQMEKWKRLPHFCRTSVEVCWCPWQLVPVMLSVFAYHCDMHSAIPEKKTTQQ